MKQKKLAVYTAVILLGLASGLGANNLYENTVDLVTVDSSTQTNFTVPKDENLITEDPELESFKPGMERYPSGIRAKDIPYNYQLEKYGPWRGVGWFYLNETSIPDRDKHAYLVEAGKYPEQERFYEGKAYQILSLPEGDDMEAVMRARVPKEIIERTGNCKEAVAFVRVHRWTGDVPAQNQSQIVNKTKVITGETDEIEVEINRQISGGPVILFGGVKPWGTDCNPVTNQFLEIKHLYIEK